MTHPNSSTQNHWGAAAAAAAAAAARLARGTRIRHGKPPRKPLNIAEWNQGSNLTDPKHGFVLQKLAALVAPAPPLKQLLSIRRLQPHGRQKQGERGRGEGDESGKRLRAGLS